MNYYSFHIGDYAAHTRRLSLLEDLAYRRLLDEYYLQEEPLLGEADLIARQIGMADYVEEVDYVLTCFFESTPEGYINKRCDEEIAKYHSKHEQAIKAGRASAEKRLNKRSTSVQPTNNQEPRTNNQINIIKPKPVKKSLKTTLPEDFGISDAVKAWAVKNGHTQLDKHLEYFVDAAKSNGYVYADWDAAFRKAISGNWAKIGQNTVSKQADDKSWQFSNEGIVAKANELGLRSEGLSYQQLKDKCLYVMTNRALQ